MDKKEFLSGLERSLSVLQEDELRDIISEYEQHIDMKQERGLTEEEAIADFGSLDELTAEILEAYHVRADYAVKKRRGQGPIPGEQKSCRGWMKAVWIRLWVFLKAGAQGLGNFLSGIGGFWKQLGQEPGKRIAVWKEERPDSGKVMEDCSEMSGKPEAAGGKAGEEEQTMRFGKQKGEEEALGSRRALPVMNMRGTAAKRGLGAAAGAFFRSSVSLAADMMYRCIRIALWGIHMAWNAAWLGFAFGCGLFGLFCLYGMGVLMVLLSQGYPLAGVTLGCAGLVMCSFSAACLGMTFLWRERKGQKSQESRKGSDDEGRPGAGIGPAKETELPVQTSWEKEEGQHA